jgi:hypothetical protein
MCAKTLTGKYKFTQLFGIHLHNFTSHVNWSFTLTHTTLNPYYKWFMVGWTNMKSLQSEQHWFSHSPALLSKASKKTKKKTF